MPELPQSMTSARLAEPRGRRLHHHLAAASSRTSAPSASTARRVERTSSAPAARARAISPLGQGGEEQRPVRDRLVARAPGSEPRSGPRRRQRRGPFTESDLPRREERLAGGPAPLQRRAGRLGRGGHRVQEPRQVRRSSAPAAAGQVGVAARHLALDVEGELGQPGHVAQPGAGQAQRQRARLGRGLGERARDQIGEVRDHRHRRVVLGRAAAHHRARPAPGAGRPPAPPRRRSPSVQTATVPPRHSRPASRRSRRGRRTWGAPPRRGPRAGPPAAPGGPAAPWPRPRR